MWRMNIDTDNNINIDSIIYQNMNMNVNAHILPLLSILVPIHVPMPALAFVFRNVGNRPFKAGRCARGARGQAPRSERGGPLPSMGRGAP